MGSSEDTPAAWDGARVWLGALDLPAAVIDGRGAVHAVTPGGDQLLTRFGAILVDGAGLLPTELRATLDTAPKGSALVWNPGGSLEDASLGCSCHPLGPGHFLLVMRELTTKNRDLSRRLHQQRLEVTGRLVTSIVHDLRAPLAAIIMHGEQLHRTADSEGAHPQIAVDIVRSARRLTHVVDGLLGFARVHAEGGASALDEVLDRVSGLVRPALRERGHTLRTYVAPGARTVRGSPLDVEQILVNLLLNASEATPATNEIVVSASPASTRPGLVRIRVSDEGPGVPEQAREHVFQPFFTTKTDATGLGLTIGRESAREQGGDLVLDPSDAKGASFSLYLPADGGSE